MLLFILNLIVMKKLGLLCGIFVAMVLSMTTLSSCSEEEKDALVNGVFEGTWVNESGSEQLSIEGNKWTVYINGMAVQSGTYSISDNTITLNRGKETKTATYEFKDANTLVLMDGEKSVTYVRKGDATGGSGSSTPGVSPGVSGNTKASSLIGTWMSTHQDQISHTTSSAVLEISEKGTFVRVEKEDISLEDSFTVTGTYTVNETDGILTINVLTPFNKTMASKFRVVDDGNRLIMYDANEEYTRLK